MRYVMMLVVLVVVTAMMAASPRAQFKPKPLDMTASYAVRLTQDIEGNWQSRETFKVCQLPAPVKVKGIEAKLAVVAMTKECPK